MFKKDTSYYTRDNSKLDFLTVINSILILIDYQPTIINGIKSGNKTIIKNSAVASARAASVFNVPVVFSSCFQEGNGTFIQELSGIFPGKHIFERDLSFCDAFEDKRVLNVLISSGRRKLIIGGLWTSTSFALTAIHATIEGFDVYGLFDASGDITDGAHHVGVERMLQAGVIPLNWMSLASEWMNDRTQSNTGEGSREAYGKYGAMLSFLTGERT